MSLEGVAERMSALLRERPQTFYELLRHLDDVEYRTILKSWGLLRERRALGRDAHGRYLIRTMGGLEGPPKPPDARSRPAEAGTPLDSGDTPMRGLEGPPKPPDARRRPGEAGTPLDTRAGS